MLDYPVKAYGAHGQPCCGDDAGTGWRGAPTLKVLAGLRGFKGGCGRSNIATCMLLAFTTEITTHVWLDLETHAVGSLQA